MSRSFLVVLCLSCVFLGLSEGRAAKTVHCKNTLQELTQAKGGLLPVYFAYSYLAADGGVCWGSSVSAFGVTERALNYKNKKVAECYSAKYLLLVLGDYDCFCPYGNRCVSEFLSKRDT
jgi:hypothetical protein